MERPKSLLDIWIFVICALGISFFANWLKAYADIRLLVLFTPYAVGLLAFFFQFFINRKPLIELYSKGYPYRKLKPYGVISAILLFEFILVWGLYTKQLLTVDEDLFLITIILAGAIVYYHLFARMKISLRFLFMAIFIPLLSAGSALGLGSYFKILNFILPAEPIGNIVFFNTIYWVFFSIFLQVVCEEPAFRGYLMQRLLPKGEISAIAYSSVCYAIWRIPFSLFTAVEIDEVLLLFCGNIIMGAIFALLFIKGRNLLAAIICHGIIDGLYMSFFASSAHPGIRQYSQFLIPNAEIQLITFWLGCLFIGLILLTIIPRKKLYAR